MDIIGNQDQGSEIQHPWGAFIGLGGVCVLVGQSAEPVSSPDAGWFCRFDRGWLGAGVWAGKVEGAVWSLPVVVVDVGSKYALELSAVEDQQPVEAFMTDGAHPALGVGVRVRGSDGSPDHRRSLGPKDFVERRAELRVAVAD